MACSAVSQQSDSATFWASCWVDAGRPGRRCPGRGSRAACVHGLVPGLSARRGQSFQQFPGPGRQQAGGQLGPDVERLVDRPAVRVHDPPRAVRVQDGPAERQQVAFDVVNDPIGTRQPPPRPQSMARSARTAAHVAGSLTASTQMSSIRVVGPALQPNRPLPDRREHPAPGRGSR